MHGRWRHWVLAGSVTLMLGGCSPGEIGELPSARKGSSTPPQGVPASLQEQVHALAGKDVELVQVFDSEQSRWALGVERATTHTQSPAAPASDAHAPLLLLIVDTDQLTASWPLGAERVLDAALSTEPDKLAVLDDKSRPCVYSGWAPSCAAIEALAMGLDLSAQGDVVFVAPDVAGSQLFELSAGSSKPRRLTQGPGHRDRPLYSPDDKRIAFVASSAHGLAAIHLLTRESGAVEQLTNRGVTGKSGFVPPPRSRAAMHWNAQGLRYEAVTASFRVDLETGAVTQEVVQ